MLKPMRPKAKKTEGDVQQRDILLKLYQIKYGDRPGFKKFLQELTNPEAMELFLQHQYFTLAAAGAKIAKALDISEAEARRRIRYFLEKDLMRAPIKEGAGVGTRRMYDNASLVEVVILSELNQYLDGVKLKSASSDIRVVAVLSLLAAYKHPGSELVVRAFADRMDFSIVDPEGGPAKSHVFVNIGEKVKRLHVIGQAKKVAG